MKVFFALFVGIWQFQLRQCSLDAAITSGFSELVVTTVYPCEVEDTISYAEMELKDDGNEKWLEFLFQTDIPIDTSTWVKIRLYQWINGAWHEMYNTEGNLCEMKNTYGPRAWKKLSKAIEPESHIEDCNLPPGTYTGKKLQLSTKDLDVPSMLFGTFRAEWQAYTAENELFICTIIEGESNRIL